LNASPETDARILDMLQALVAEVRELRKSIPAQLVDVAAAAKHFDVSEATIRRRIKRREMPFTRVGRAVRIDLTKVRVLDSTEVEVMAQRAMAR
jgi:excisionase family DNA binding protein